ncbi:hypothetical protein LRP88_11099 [Fusarium phalaenopsidis]
MLDAKTKIETSLAWVDIKRLIKSKDANELRSALKKLSGVVPSKIYESVKDLWKDPKSSEVIDLLLSWGPCKKRLDLFRYLLMTNSANKSSELEDLDDDDDDGSPAVPMDLVAVRLLRVSQDLNGLLRESRAGEGMSVLHYIVQYGSENLLAVVVELAMENRLEGIETLLMTGSQKKTSPMGLIVELKRLDMLRQLLSSLPELMIEEAIIQQAIDGGRDEFLLLFAQLRPQCATVSLLKSAISGANITILEEVLSHRSSFFFGHGLLSDAVTGGQVEVIHTLMKKCPQLAIEYDGEDKPALSHLEEIADSNRRDEVRSAVSPYIIRRARSELEASSKGSGTKSVIEMIRMWLAEPKDRRKEISLDLGGFQHSSRSIDPFLKMIRESSTKITTKAAELKVEFESTLRYVDIPIPDFPEAQAGGMTDTERSEAKVILEWLRTKKEVSGIYELRVRDSLFFPHSEEVIAQCLHGFDVEMLDWMRVDMSAKPLLKTCRNLKKLMLYASNWATLSYWTSEEVMDALSGFSELKEVTIFILADLIGPAYGATYATETRERLDALEKSKPFKFSMEFSLRSWFSLRRRKEEAPVLKKTTAVEVTQLESFIQAYSVLQEELEDEEFVKEVNPIFKEETSVRVAVIDTGVDPNCIQCSQISGASFVPSDSGESPWWFSYHPHGTQMANVISELNPHCKLLVAKVGDSDMDMTVERLIQALRWAVDSKADIISLSSAVFKADTNLELAVQDAIAAGVVIIASAAGEAHKQQEAYPADYPNVLKIVATDSRGRETAESLASQADYMFPEDRILAPTTFLGTTNEADEISGTSVATAIASGVASLVLACHRLCLSNQDHLAPWAEHSKLKRKIVKRVFDTMVDNEGKFVKPWLFFNEADQHNWGEASRTLKWLGNKTF